MPGKNPLTLSIAPTFVKGFFFGPNFYFQGQKRPSTEGRFCQRYPDVTLFAEGFLLPDIVQFENLFDFFRFLYQELD